MKIKLFIILWRKELHMSKKFHIFSDESNHDKSITNKGDNINIDNKGLSREYVRSFLKIDTSCLNCVRDEVESLEKRYFSCQVSEPKGKNLFKLSEKVGLKNLSEGATNYFLKLLDIIDKYDIKIFLVIFNKFEYVINKSVEIDLNRLSKKIKCNLEEDKEIKYSLAKFFENHYSDRLCNALFKEKNSQTNYSIKKAIYDMNKGLKDHKLKDFEYIVGKNLYSLIDDGIISFNTRGSYKWDYTFESKVFLDLMNQDDNRKITISFDKGTRVSEVFKEQLISRNIENIEVTEDIESKEDIFIRFSDYFATFFGKLSRSYSNSFKLKNFETGKINYSTVESIPQSWFELDETQFYLAKRIGELINKGSVILLHGILADTPIGLKNYFQFISDFKEFSDYQAVDNVKLSQLNNQRLSETWNTSYSKQGIFFSPYDATYGALSEDFGKS